MKNLTKILIPLVIILVALAAAEALYYFTKLRVPGTLSSDKASEKAMSYINNDILEGKTSASLLGISEESGVYKLQLKIADQEYTSYITKDAKFLFPQGQEIPENISKPGSDISKRETAQAQLFVMSFCPYGNQAEKLMKDVVGLLGNKADIQLHYVIYSNYQGGGPNYCLDKDSKYCSMHGIQEMHQDIRELCLQKYQKDKLWDFVDQIDNKCSAQNADSCWEGVARNTGVNIDQIKKCQKDEALTLAEQELQLNKKYGITGSPQLIINDTEYKGSRSAEGYKTAICNGFNNPPEECSQTLSGGTNTPQGGCE